MKYLGVDYGRKRIGLAVSDEDGKLAFPFEVVANDANVLEKIKKIIAEEKIEKVVVGESKNFKGEPNEITPIIERFSKDLKEKTKLKVEFEPEFMTSSQAEHIQGKTKMHDASAAAIILQSFLERRKNML